MKQKEIKMRLMKRMENIEKLKKSNKREEIREDEKDKKRKTVEMGRRMEKKEEESLKWRIN